MLKIKVPTGLSQSGFSPAVSMKATPFTGLLCEYVYFTQCLHYLNEKYMIFYTKCVSMYVNKCVDVHVYIYIYNDAYILNCTVVYEYNLSKPLQQNKTSILKLRKNSLLQKITCPYQSHSKLASLHFTKCLCFQQPGSGFLSRCT